MSQNHHPGTVRQAPGPAAESDWGSAAGPALNLAWPVAGLEPVEGFRLIRPLGRGGFGEVWLAEGPGEVHVALKFIPFGNKSNPELRALDLMKGIRHPHLLSLFGWWERGGYLVLAVELADGSLADRLQSTLEAGGTGLCDHEVMSAVGDAAEGIDHLNTLGLQHRDVKPANLLVVGGGVKVADFGLVKLVESGEVSHTGSFTAAYAAPEVFNGVTSAKTDQYALAVSYCELRGGRMPFTGGRYELMIKHGQEPPDLTMLPESERPAVARALAKQPADRWPDCRSFVNAVAAVAAVAASPSHRGSNVAGSDPAVSQAPSPARKLPNRPSRPRRRYGLVTCAAAAGILTIVASRFMGPPTDGSARPVSVGDAKAATGAAAPGPVVIASPYHKSPVVDDSKADPPRTAAARPADGAGPPAGGPEIIVRPDPGSAYVHEKILADVRRLPIDDRRHVRYFAINHLLAPAADIDSLQRHRNELADAVNRLAPEGQPVILSSLDEPTDTVFRVDERQFAWNNQPLQRWRDRRAVGPSPVNLFDLVLLEYPHGVAEFGSRVFDELADEYIKPAGLLRPVAYVRADWFVAALSATPLALELSGGRARVGQSQPWTSARAAAFHALPGGNRMPVAPLDGLSFRNGGAGPAPPIVGLRTNRPDNRFRPGDGLQIFVSNESMTAVFVELTGTSARGEISRMTPTPVMVRPGQTFQFPPDGASIPIRDLLGREQITLFAADAEFPAGDVLRGAGVADRFVHPVFGPFGDPNGGQVSLTKKTIEIETR